MIDENSRYYRVETRKLTGPDGREIAYKARRFPPLGKNMPLLTEAVVGQGDRLDQITARTLGDPGSFWRICDANDALDPHELTGEPGAVLRIPIPEL